MHARQRCGNDRDGLVYELPCVVLGSAVMINSAVYVPGM
jgi:hypothetical protein